MTCPRCGEASCSDPDSKACSDNCIGRLQRQLALAQTEIKGYMRVKDDLQGRIAELEKVLTRAREYVSGFDPEVHLGAPEVVAAIDALKSRA